MNEFEEVSRTLFVGAKVTIDPKSEYFKCESKTNPRSIAGEVKVCHQGAYGVTWSNGYKNWYYQGDLKVLGEVVDE